MSINPFIDLSPRARALLDARHGTTPSTPPLTPEARDKRNYLLFKEYQQAKKENSSMSKTGFANSLTNSGESLASAKYDCVSRSSIIRILGDLESKHASSLN